MLGVFFSCRALHLQDADGERSVGAAAHVRGDRGGDRRREQRCQVDTRFRFAPTLAGRDKPDGPVRGDRPPVERCNVESQLPEAFGGENLPERPEDARTEPLPEIPGVEDDPDLGRPGERIHVPYKEGRHELPIAQAGIGPVLLGGAGQLPEERIGLGPGDPARRVMAQERVLVGAPGPKGVEIFAPERPDRNVRLLEHVFPYMRTVVRSLAGAVAALAATSGLAVAQSADRCSRESFPVDGTPLAITVCSPADSQSPVALAETLVRGSASFDHTFTVDVVRGASVTHAVDEIPLDQLGIAKRLHLTIAYRAGRATIEHALLLPGALVLK